MFLSLTLTMIIDLLNTSLSSYSCLFVCRIFFLASCTKCLWSIVLHPVSSVRIRVCISSKHIRYWSKLTQGRTVPDTRVLDVFSFLRYAKGNRFLKYFAYSTSFWKYDNFTEFTKLHFARSKDRTCYRK